MMLEFWNQFQFLDDTTNETDASGHCEVTYTSTDPTKFKKTKEYCTSPDLPFFTNFDEILATTVVSSRLTDYEMDKGNKFIVKIEAAENHQLSLAAYEEAGSEIEARQTLILKNSSTGDALTSDSAEGILNEIISKERVQFTQESLITERTLRNDDTNHLAKAVKESWEFLKSDSLGALPSAKALVGAVLAARKSSKEEIGKVLGAKKNQPIL